MVTGCYAQVDPEQVAAIPGVDLVLGNLDKLRLAEHLADALPAGGTRAGAAAERAAAGVHGRPSVSPYPGIPSSKASSSATSTATPGPSSRSRPAATPAAATASSPSRGDRRAACPWPTCCAQVRLLAARGYREVVLTGINLGSWGRDTGEGSLADLLRALLVGAARSSGSG